LLDHAGPGGSLPRDTRTRFGFPEPEASDQEGNTPEMDLLGGISAMRRSDSAITISPVEAKKCFIASRN
jgi:hypothetical protein